MAKQAFESVRCDKCGRSFAVLKGQAARFRCPDEACRKAPAEPGPAPPAPKETKP